MRHELNSTAIVAVEENDDGSVTLFFQDDRSATYEGIPYWVVMGLVDAPSAGRYFNQNIRGQYNER